MICWVGKRKFEIDTSYEAAELCFADFFGSLPSKISVTKFNSLDIWNE